MNLCISVCANVCICMQSGDVLLKKCCQPSKNIIEDKGGISYSSSSSHFWVSQAPTPPGERPGHSPFLILLNIPLGCSVRPSFIFTDTHTHTHTHTKSSVVKSHSNHGCLLVLIYHRLLATDNTAWKHPWTSRFLQEYRQERKMRAGPRKKEITHDFPKSFL